MNKRILSTVLSVVFVINTIGPLQIFASDHGTSTYCTWDTITACREKHSAPDIAGADGKVFAGWYEDEAYKDPLEVDKVVDGAYAKFVDAKTLSAKGQITKGATADDAVTALRLLTTVDSLYYESVGFRVEANGKEQYITSKTVYTAVTSYTKGDGATYHTPQETFSSDSAYFMTYEITQVPQSFYGDGFKVTPIWTTMDGIVVTGETKTLKVYAGLENNKSAEDLTYGTVWSAPSTVKVGNVDSKSTITASQGASLSYTAVRNEYESAQLILTANQSVDADALYATDLVGETERILAEHVDVYTQKYVTYAGTSNDKYPEGGTMPDALLPMDAADAYGENSIKANQNGSLWVTTYIPKGVAAGTYTGDFLLVVEGTTKTEVIKIPVTLEVVDYTLTDEVNAKTLFSWRYDRVAPGELDGSLAMMEEYYEFFQDYRISLQSLPLGTMSGEEVKDAIQTYGERFSSFTILSGQVGDISLGVTNNKELFQEQIYAIAEVSGPNNNFFEKAMCYSVDEPHMYNEGVPESLAASQNKRIEYLKECIDAIEADTTGRFNTFKQINKEERQASILNILDVIPISYNSCEWLVENKTNEGVVAFFESTNCLCPMFNVYDSDYYSQFLNLCNQYDIELWWYGCAGPTTPYPTYHISDPNLLSSRSLSWMQKKYDVQGNLYWDAAAYTDEVSAYYNEYLNVYEFPFHLSNLSAPAGDGFLAYPGAAYGVYGPIPSVRLMSIRDGMEEYEILCDVEEAFEKKAGDFSGITAIDVDATMDSIFYKPLYSEGLKMNADGTALNFTGLRSRLLNMVVTLEKGLAYASSEIVYSKDSTIIPGFYKNYKAVFSCYAQEGSTIKINGSPYTSGQSYEEKGSSTYSEVNTSVTIEVTNAAGETRTYTKYVGKGIETTATSTSTEVEAKGIVKTEKTYNTEENSELILSFDSYANITGTSIRVSKFLGETKINTDSQYITEGTGSWMIRPEGDYGKSNDYPWFKMRLTDTTFATDNFSNYNAILLDIYNASDEEISVQLSFAAHITDEVTDGIGGEYTLAANAWTTCKIDLTEAIYSTGNLFDMSQAIETMSLTFNDKKTNRDDAVPTIYIDNLRGVLGTRETLEYSFAEGIDFEEVREVGLLQSSYGGKKNVKKSHVSYADTTLSETANLIGLGKFGMKADVTGAVWPEFRMRFDSNYDAGKAMMFWLYVETDGAVASGQTYKVEAFNSLTGTSYAVKNGNCSFNKWVQIQIPFTENTEYLRFFVNLDKGGGVSKLGNTPVCLYMDEFQVIDSVSRDTMEVATDGTLTLKNGDGDSGVQYTYEQEVKKGEAVSFDIHFNSTEALTISALANGTVSQYDAEFDSWTKSTTITFIADRDMESVTINVQYAGSNQASKICTISNFVVCSQFDILTFDEASDMNYVKGNSGTNNMLVLSQENGVLKGVTQGGKFPSLVLTLGRILKQEQKISFNVYVKAEETDIQNNRFIMEVNGAWAHTGLQFNSWQTVTYTLPVGISRTTFMANFSQLQSLKNGASVEIYIDDIRLGMGPGLSVEDTADDEGTNMGELFG